MRRALVAALTLAGATSCSFVVNDLTPGRCTRFEDCAPLNERDQLDAISCELWTCDTEQLECVRRPRDRDGDRAFGPYPARATCNYEVTDCDDANPDRAPGKTEVCDGLDNNCDLAIDETTDAIRPLARETHSVSPMPAPSAGGGVAFPASQDPDAREVIVAGGFAARDRASHVTLPETVVDLGWRAYCAMAAPDLGRCPGDPMCDTKPVCHFGDPAVDAAHGQAWIAASSSAGCSPGQSSVRLGKLGGGFASSATSGDAVMGVPPCSEGPARFPALAILRDRPSGAALYLGLVAHLAEDRPESSPRGCGTGGVPVRARVVRLDETTGMGKADFVAGAPMLDLAATSATSAPAVVALGTGGWVVGFGAAGGGAALFWVPASGDSATRIGTVGTETTAEVRIAPVAGTSPTVLGVLRQAACDAGPIVFQTVRFDAADPAGSFSAGTPVTLAPAGRAPALVRVDAGFVVEGFARDRTPPIEGPMASAGQTGGWVAMWSDAAGGTFASRILALDDQPLGSPDRVSDAAGRTSWLARAAGGAAAPLVDAFVFGADDRLRSIALYCAHP